MQDLTERPSAADLYDRFVAIRAQQKLRHRDAAHELGVREGEVIAAAVGRRDGLRAVRLKGPWPELYEQMPRVGRVMVLTRNETTVHEKTGRYEELSHEGLMGLALGKDIDLRIFYHRWAQAYAVSESGEKGESRSLQIYDGWGDAVHKVFLREDSDLDAWFALVEQNASDDQSPGGAVKKERDPAAVTPDGEIDVGAFHDAWAGMKDTHEFFPLLRRFKLARTQALRLAPGDFAYRVRDDAARVVLERAAAAKAPIMCFVGNPGMIQIHSGPVERVAVMGPWLNVLDPGFNLHLREDRIAATWVVKKPTSDGVVTSVELFDGDGETMAMFFGERKPGKPEREDWRGLVAGLERLDG